MIQEYIGNCYTFRGYAYAAQEMHDKATKDLSTASKMQKLDSASEYNYLISQSIMIFEKKPEQAILLLTKCRELYPKNPETFIYEGLIQFTLKNIDKSKILLSQAIELKPGDSDLHFFRGILCYYEGKYAESIQDLEITIEKAEDNNAYHYLCRGLCYAQLGLYNEAINDFSAVIQLDESLSQAYLYRGRCAFLQEDTNLAYSDFQKLLYTKPDDPIVHIHAGDLLLLTQNTEDAIKAYNNSLIKGKNKQAYIQKTKCYLLLGNLKAAIQELEEALKYENDRKISQDCNVLRALQMCMEENFAEALATMQSFSSDGLIIKQRDIRKYIGICFFYIGEYQFSQSIFQSMLESQDPEMVEIMYNLALSNIMGEYYEAALTQLNELAEIVEGNDKGKILLLSGFIQLGLENSSQGKQFFSEAYKYDPASVSAYLKQNSSISILPFNSYSSFASEFPFVTASIGNTSPISIRPSISTPTIDPPSLDFQVEEIIFQQFQIKNIKCKPEAPWLNRVQGMIQFTDEVQDILSETVTESVNEEAEVYEEDVFEGDIGDFKKYRSALCLPRGESDQLLKNMQAAFHNNNDEGATEL